MHVFDWKNGDLRGDNPEGICRTMTGYCTTYTDQYGVVGAAEDLSRKVRSGALELI